jgi:hypothetical protein
LFCLFDIDLGINWLNNLDSYINTDDTDLDIPNVDITKMNRDKKFAGGFIS